MEKIVIHRAGSFDQLNLETHPDPTPGANDVLIDVKGAGVNYADTTVRRGLYKTAKKRVGWPITPGFEVSGVVAAVGVDVTDLAVGDEVLAVTLFGGYASKVIAPRAQVFAVPKGFDLNEAAAFPAVYMTAYHALFVLAHPRASDTVLVHSAAGGVGTALVQLLKSTGTRVIGVVGKSHKVQPVLDNGADEVIDKSTQDLWREARRLSPKGYDIILDANGPSTLKQSYDHLAPAGKLVAYGAASMLPQNGRTNWFKLAKGWLSLPRWSPLELIESNKSVMGFNLSDMFQRNDLLAEAMTTLGELAAAGSIRPPKVTTWPLGEAAAAHRAIESGTTVGKLVLNP